MGLNIIRSICIKTNTLSRGCSQLIKHKNRKNSNIPAFITIGPSGPPRPAMFCPPFSPGTWLITPFWTLCWLGRPGWATAWGCWRLLARLAAPATAAAAWTWSKTGAPWACTPGAAPPARASSAIWLVCSTNDWLAALGQVFRAPIDWKKN